MHRINTWREGLTDCLRGKWVVNERERDRWYVTLGKLEWEGWPELGYNWESIGSLKLPIVCFLLLSVVVAFILGSGYFQDPQYT